MTDVTPQQLHKFLNSYFSLGEIQSLCFELNIPYEDLSGDGRSAKNLALVDYARRHSLYETLVSYVQAQRPNAKIGTITGSSTSTPSTSTPNQADSGASSRVEYHFHGQVVGAAIGGSTVNAQNIAGRDIIIGQEPKTRDEFAEQLKQLQALLQEAIAAREIPDADDAATIAEDIQDVAAEMGRETPRSSRISRRLEEVKEILDGAGGVAETAGKAGATVLKAIPIVAGLAKAVQLLF